MSQMLTEIMRIVAEDVSSRVNQKDVLFEAITNSVQANATKIICTLYSADASFEANGVEIGRKTINNITIWDNGDGFDEANYKSFCKYRSQHKKELGCKGVGRFSFLKVYRNSSYTSEIASEQIRKAFSFNSEFDTDLIKVEDIEVTSNSTEVKFTTLNPEYLDLSKDLDRRIYLDLEEIREKVLLHLIPTLFFYKKTKNRDVIIEFIDDTTKGSVQITSSDVPSFLEKEIVIDDKYGAKHKFKLYYVIDHVKGKLNAFYCANNRTVYEFSEQKFNFKLPLGYSGFFLLEGDYLNAKINNDRNEFGIFPVKIDNFSPLSWEIINKHLKTAISELVKIGIPEAETANREKLKTIEQERPYLMSYIDDEDLNIAGFIDAKDIIDKAKKKFDKAKERVIKSSGKNDYSNDELDDAIQLAQDELVAYIFDRAMVLERLQKLVDKKEQVEKIIHDLFMEQGRIEDYFTIRKNNLWLLDDRFTSYSYAASDKKIKKILKDIGETIEGVDNPEDEPDIALFFSHDPNNNTDRLKAVIVEVKPFDYNSKPVREKFAGLVQLRQYITAFKDKEKIEEVYGFLVTDVDAAFEKELFGDSYKKFFSTDAPIYHRFFETTGISLYVVGAETLIADAKARNTIFLDIIKKQSKLRKILEDNPEGLVEELALKENKKEKN